MEYTHRFGKKLFDDLDGDGSHWGLSDWYACREDVLRTAVFKKGDFDTGWYASKKEIASGRVARTGNTYTCFAWCSDDFDTEGNGQCSFEQGPAALDEIVDRIRAGLDAALVKAEENRKDNQVYQGYCIGYADDEGNRRDWIWSYVQPVGDALVYCYESPPGDYYGKWGWHYGGVASDKDKLTPEEREQIEEWITSYDRTEATAVFGRWVIEEWG